MNPSAFNLEGNLVLDDMPFEFWDLFHLELLIDHQKVQAYIAAACSKFL